MSDRAQSRCGSAHRPTGLRILLGIALILLVALAALGLRWAFQHFVEPPGEQRIDGDPRLSFTRSAHLAINARKRFESLAHEDKRTLRSELAASVWPLEKWLEQLNRSAPAMICLGERHEASVRAFLAERLLPRLEMDVLMLESDSDWVRQALSARAAGEPIPELLGAPMAGVLDTVLERPHPARIVGVDESALERRARRALARADLARRAREDTIVNNLRRRWQRGDRHVVLFGALHCRDISPWFFARLPRESDVLEGSEALNAVLLARYEEPSIQVLMYLLDEVGLGADVLVVPDTDRFPEQVLAWLPNVADAFATFRAAVLFDDRRLAAQ